MGRSRGSMKVQAIATERALASAMVDVAAGLGYVVAGLPRDPRNHRGLERLVAIGHNAPPTRREQPVNRFIPKMFTVSSGAKVVKNNAFQSSTRFPRFHLFLDRTVAARRS